MARPCMQCAVYRMQILMLKAQIERLRRIIHGLEERLRKIYDYTVVVWGESDPVVRKRSGVKRAVYAYHMARHRVASKVLDLLR